MYRATSGQRSNYSSFLSKGYFKNKPEVLKVHSPSTTHLRDFLRGDVHRLMILFVENSLFNCRKFFLSLLKRQNYLKGNKNCSSHVFDADNTYATSTATTKHFCKLSASHLHAGKLQNYLNTIQAPNRSETEKAYIM